MVHFVCEETSIAVLAHVRAHRVVVCAWLRSRVQFRAVGRRLDAILFDPGRPATVGLGLRVQPRRRVVCVCVCVW